MCLTDVYNISQKYCHNQQVKRTVTKKKTKYKLWQVIKNDASAS